MLSGVVRNFCYIKIKNSAYINNWEETYNEKLIICAVLTVTLGVGSNITANATEVFSNYKETVKKGVIRKKRVVK